MHNRTGDNQDRREVFGSARVISIVSGKGGVGKSVLTYGLAERLSHESLRVLIVDADLHCGNQHILANLTVGYGLREFLSDTLNLAQAVSSVTTGIDLLPSLPGHTLDFDFDTGAAVNFISRLREQAGPYDIVLIDQASGVSEPQLAMSSHSDDVYLIALPELTSISDVYGLYKRLHQAKTEARCHLIVNRTNSSGSTSASGSTGATGSTSVRNETVATRLKEEGEYIRDKFGALAERFIGSVPAWAGSIPEDDAVRQSVARQKTIAEIGGQSAALKALGALARAIISNTPGFSSLSSRDINNNRQTADIRG